MLRSVQLTDIMHIPHHVAGDAPATVYTVSAITIMVLAGGLGGLPFFFVPKGLSKRAAGLANALSAGVMLSASYTMVYEAHNGPRGCVCGLLLGALFVRWSRSFMEEGHADGLLGEKTRGLHVFLATMALQRPAGVGVAYGDLPVKAGVRRGALVHPWRAQHPEGRSRRSSREASVPDEPPGGPSSRQHRNS